MRGFRSGGTVAEKYGVAHEPGKSLTSWPSLETDISNAGGVWRDEQVLLCPAMGFDLVTSRKPDDLDAFNDQAGPDLRPRGVRVTR